MKLIRKTLFLLILILLMWPFVKEGIWQKSNVNYTFSDYRTNDYHRALRFDSPTYRAIAWIRSHTKIDDKVFVMRQSDFANYADRIFIYALDPRSEPLYRADSVDELKKIISEMKLEYFLLPSYDLPFYYNTKLMELLSNPQWADLLYYDEGVRIVKLRKKSQSQRLLVKQTQIPLSNELWFCSTDQSYFCNAKIITSPDGNIEITTDTKNTNSVTDLIYGIGPSYISPSNMGLEMPIKPDSDYEFVVEAEGSGKFQVDMAVFTKGRSVGLRTLWSGVVHPDKAQTIRAQFRFSSFIDSGKPLFRIFGKGYVKIKSILLNQYDAIKKDEILRLAEISKKWSVLITGSRKKMAYWEMQSFEGKSYLNSIMFPSSMSQILISPSFNLKSKTMIFSLIARGCGQLSAHIVNAQKELFFVSDFNLPKISEISTSSSFELNKRQSDYLTPFRKIKQSIKDVMNPFDLQSYVDDLEIESGKGHLIIVHRSGFHMRGKFCDPSSIQIDKLSIRDDCNSGLCPVIFEEDF